MAEIALSQLTKTYDNGFQAVRGISLDIPDGAFCVLVGPSGCGKSTTLRMVAGLEGVSSGTIAIGERVVNDVHPKDRDIAMVFQNYALYPHMSVRENMAFALKLRKVPKPDIEKRVKAAAETLGLTSMLDRKPALLSGGQRQRVAVGRAIVREPKVFLFDEPLSNLDAKLRVTTRAEIKALQLRLKTTTIYVTHDQEEAMSLADVMVVMAAGVIQQKGTPMELYRKPANRFVAAFVGLPPMNMIDGVLESTAAGVRFVSAMRDHAGATCALTLNPSHSAMLKGKVGTHVVLGVRAQALTPAKSAGDVWSLRANVVEAMGDHLDTYLSPAEPAQTVLVARCEPVEDLRAGAVARFAIDPNAVHVFEPGEFGQNLTLGV